MRKNPSSTLYRRSLSALQLRWESGPRTAPPAAWTHQEESFKLRWPKQAEGSVTQAWQDAATGPKWPLWPCLMLLRGPQPPLNLGRKRVYPWKFTPPYWLDRSAHAITTGYAKSYGLLQPITRLARFFDQDLCSVQRNEWGTGVVVGLWWWTVSGLARRSRGAV